MTDYKFSNPVNKQEFYTKMRAAGFDIVEGDGKPGDVSVSIDDNFLWLAFDEPMGAVIGGSRYSAANVDRIVEAIQCVFGIDVYSEYDDECWEDDA